MEKQCQECGRPFQGRSDKKFCADSCRNAFNNRINGAQHNYMRNINNVLARNRRTLEKLNPNGKVKTTRSALIRNGFDFSYLTSTYETRNGDIYKFCYEYGYLELDGESILLVKRDDDSD